MKTFMKALIIVAMLLVPFLAEARCPNDYCIHLAVSTIGGTSDDLDAVLCDNGECITGDTAIVIDKDAGTFRAYSYLATSADAESDPDTIQPDDVSGNGRWIGATTGGSSLTQEQVEDFAGALIEDGTGTHTGIAVTYQDATGDVDIVVDHDTAANFSATEHVAEAAISHDSIADVSTSDHHVATVDSNLTQEEVDDFVDLLLNDVDAVNTLITITYDDVNDAMDFVVTNTLSSYVDDLTHTATSDSTWTNHNDYPAACAASNWMTALGDTSTCSQPAFTDISGSVTDAQVPNNITVDLAAAVTTNANLTGEVTSVGNAAVIVESFLQENGASELTGETLGTACAENQILKANATGGLDCAADATGAGGSAITFDIGDDGGNDSVDVTEIATTGDTNTIFTEPIADKILIAVGNNWPTADAATALSGDPTDCGANEFAQSIVASGNLTCAAIADADVPDTITIDTATTASALAANGGNCAAGSAPLGVDAAGAVETCTDYEEDLSDEAGLYAALSDVTNFLQTGDALAGDDITDGSVDASELDETADYSFTQLSGKQDRNNSAVDDDLCTGEQGLWWYDTTDSQFEFCNANSGVPVALPTVAGDVTDVFDCASGDCNAVTVETGESLLLDPGGEVHSTENVISVNNDSGATIYACTAVYISGFDIPSDLPEISIADGDNAAQMPAVGLVESDIANGANGLVVLMGTEDAWDTATAEGWSVGDALYVNVSGTSADADCGNTLTNTRPTGTTALIQKVGSVSRVHATAGEITVSGANRSNDVPNLEDAYLWVGNATNVATAVQLSSDVVMANTGAVTIQANSVALTTDTTGNYAAGDGEAGAATTGDSATAFFAAGTIEHERGGLEADVNAYDGLIGITGGATYNQTGTTTQIVIFDGAGAPTSAALSGDATMTNGGVVTVVDDQHNHTTTTLSGIVNADLSGTAGITGANIAADTVTHANILDADQTDSKCIWFEDPVAADDFKSIWANKTANAFQVTEIWAESDQTVTFMLQVDDGSPADCDTVDLAPAAGEAEDTSLNGDCLISAGEEIDLAITSVANTPTWVSICFTGNWVD
jgi:hypothetical protein